MRTWCAVSALAILWTVPACMRAEPGSAQPVAIVTEVDGSARVLTRPRGDDGPGPTRRR